MISDSPVSRPGRNASIPKVYLAKNVFGDGQLWSQESVWANSLHSGCAKELGILVITRAQLRNQTPNDTWQQAIDHLGGVESIHVDIDVDVCDRSVVPGCPAAAPGGISADEIRQFALLAGKTKTVTSIDITEIDATADSADQRTIRLAALLILEAATGLALRNK